MKRSGRRRLIHRNNGETVIGDFDPDVWSRLPFWVRELLRMIEKTKKESREPMLLEFLHE
jgi:hypothetical protein